MKLIKLSADHYIIVDESKQPVDGYYYDNFIKDIRDTNGAEYGKADHCWQITHSTKAMYKDEYISLSEVKELLGEVDVNKKADEYAKYETPDLDNDYLIGVSQGQIDGYAAGYNQALEDNKDRKYTDEDMLTIRNQLVTILPVGDVNTWDMIQAVSKYTKWLDEYVESIHQLPTSWNVEFVNDKINLI